MKILLLEDEKLAAQKLLQLLYAYFEHELEIKWVQSIQQGLKYLKKNGDPDLILSDIELGKVVEIISQFRLVIFSCKEFTKSLHNGLWKDFLSFLQGKRAALMANYFCYFALLDGKVFRLYEQYEVKSPIIFATAYDQYLLKAFQTNGIAYLLKPYVRS